MEQVNFVQLSVEVDRLAIDNALIPLIHAAGIDWAAVAAREAGVVPHRPQQVADDVQMPVQACDN